MEFNSKEYYKILEVDENATEDEIKNSYKKLIRKYHPDICSFEKKICEAKSSEINVAYEILGDYQKREEYDDFLNWEIEEKDYDIWITVDEQFNYWTEISKGIAQVKVFDVEERVYFEINLPNNLISGENTLRKYKKGHLKPDGTRGDLYLKVFVSYDLDKETIKILAGYKEKRGVWFWIKRLFIVLFWIAIIHLALLVFLGIDIYG